MGQLSDRVRDAMVKKAQAVKEQMGSGESRRRLDLSGKKAIVAPGHEVVVRLLPRWDILKKYRTDAGGKVTVNPEYQDDVVFFEAFEHWWDSPDGRSTTREWCPCTFDENAHCPLCEAAEKLAESPDQNDKALGARIRAKEVFLFNAILGRVGQRAFTEDGRPDIRYLSAPATIFQAVSAFMTGGDEAEFARGDITDPRDGYDIKLIRPAKQGDRWRVDCAPQPSVLFAPEEKEKAKGWPTLLVDVEALVRQEVKSYDTLYAAYYGTEGGTPPGPPAEEFDTGGAPPFDFPDFPEPGVPSTPHDAPPLPSPAVPSLPPRASVPPPQPRRPAGRRR